MNTVFSFLDLHLCSYFVSIACLSLFTLRTLLIINNNMWLLLLLTNVLWSRVIPELSMKIRRTTIALSIATLDRRWQNLLRKQWQQIIWSRSVCNYILWWPWERWRHWRFLHRCVQSKNRTHWKKWCFFVLLEGDGPWQSQLTTINTNVFNETIRVCTAQGFGFDGINQSWASFYHGKRLSKDYFYAMLNKTSWTEYSIKSRDTCDGAGMDGWISHLEETFDL